MADPTVPSLRNAIAQLYAVFAPYPLVLPMNLCDCGCVTPADMDRIRARPLRGLRADDLEKYASKAITTWGEVHDFKHFLPRLFELMAHLGEVGYTPPETLFNKLDYAEWRAWPEPEQRAIETYFAALWEELLRSSPHRARGGALDAGTILAAFAQAQEDLFPYLRAWRVSGSRAALDRLAAYIMDEFDEIILHGRLRDPHWVEKKPQMLQVLTWLEAPETRRQLEAGLDARAGRGRELLERSIDLAARLRLGHIRLSTNVENWGLPGFYEVIGTQPYPLLFATVSGAHLYGFPSRDSDYDVRGAHILPAEVLLGLTPPKETIKQTADAQVGRVELVTHDVKKFFSLLLKRNGYVLEQLFSPLVIWSSREHQKLKAIGRRCITRGHADHYLGFADKQWKMLEKKGPRVKLLLYVFRVLLTGIHLMRTGEVEANLPRLSEDFRLAYLDDLIAQKIAGEEHVELAAAELEFFETEYLRLRRMLIEAQADSALPEQAPSVTEDLNALLLRLRRQSPRGDRHRGERSSEKRDRTRDIGESPGEHRRS